MAEIEGWQSDTLSFTDQFQKQIIIAIVQEPKLYESLGIYIKPEAFEINAYKVIFREIQNFYSDYRSIPTKEIVLERLNKKYADKDIPEPVIENVNDIFGAKRLANSTSKCIEDSVRNFIQNQALKKAIMDSLEDLDDVDKHLNIKDRIEKALRVGDDISDLGVDVYSDDEIISRWQRRLSGEEIPKISTGWSSFDEVFDGYGCGELFSFMGPANSGKSMYLANAGANMLLQKKNVMHISLEMSQETVAQRYDMRLLGLNKDELKTPVANERIKALLEKDVLGELIVKRFPSSTATAGDIETYMKRQESTTGFVPDVLIVDYADIMRSSNKYNERRFELELIYQELRNIAIQFNIPVITATQLNREGLKELNSGGILTEEHIAEAYGISRHADVMVTINATPQDIIKHNSIVYVAKNRDGRKGDQIRMYVDFEKALVKEWAAVPQKEELKKYKNR